MTKLQEKMELLKKEIKEIEILEKAEKNRNSQAEIIVKQTRRLMDIKHLNTMSPDACGVRMSTMAHFKMTYMSPICRPECPIKQTCSTLHNLSAKGSRKSSGAGKSSKIATVKVTFTFSKNTGICEITEPIKIPAFHASEWLNSDTRKALRQSLVKENGLTSNQLAGISKNFNAMGYKMGHIDWN